MRTELIPATKPADPADAGAFRLGRVARPLAAYGVVLALTLLVLTLALRLWDLDFHTPTNYGGDGTLHLMFTKGLLENGWFLTNPSLGAPGEMDLREFPAVDTLPALLIKGLGLFTHDPALLNNLFFLLTFPLASLAAFYACRQMGFLFGPSLLCALLHTFAQYHFVRSEGHLYLSAYFMAPLATLVAWWIAEGRLLGPDGAWWRGRLPLAGGICVLTSLCGAYYPFFAGIILVTACFLALCARRDRRHFVAGSLLTALLAAGLLACLLPTILYLHRHPGQPAAGTRRPEEAEIFGLKIAQVLLPIDGHRLGAVDRFKTRYDRRSPLVNENTTAAVGVVAAAGFLGLLGWLLFRPVARTASPARDEPDGSDPLPVRRFLDTFSVFNAAAVLFGTIGGFGELFALFVSPQIRGLNRISVFIDFFALAAVACCLDALVRSGSRAVRVIGGIGVGALLLLGLLDQTRPINPVAYRVMSHDYRADQSFFRRAAASLPAGAMVFQLPYMSFPENGPEEGLQDYSLFGGYVLSDGLRWSYGAMRDSPGDQWQQAVARLPWEAAARQLALAGFSGIHVERAGYADFGAALAARLQGLLGPPVATESERLFFSLLDYTRALRATMTPEQWRQAADLARHRVYVHFDTGFQAPSRKPEPVSRWCLGNSALTLTNPAGQSRRVRLRMLASTDRTAPVSLVMTRGQDRWTWTLNHDQQPLAVFLELPPGECSLHFSCPVGGKATARTWLMTDFQIDQDELPINPPTPAAAAGPPGAP